MRQYLDAKQQHRDAILFFRMGDFYEMFYEDALVAARALELTLTSRSKDANGGGIPMCGVPFHAVDGYIARLVKKGFRVAICDQVEDPRKAKGIVKREVVRVVSPGTLTDAGYLDAREPAFLMAIAPARRREARVDTTPSASALLDLSTGEFTAAEYIGADGLQALADELAVLKPREIVVPRQRAGLRRASAANDGRCSHRPVCPSRRWTPGHSSRVGAAHAARSTSQPAASKDSASTAPGRGRRRPARSCTTCAATQKVDLAHVRADELPPARRRAAHRPDDAQASRDPQGSEGGREGSLLDELDRTMTSIGSRLLRSWLLRPLLALEPIRDRLDAVEELAFRTTDRGKFRDAIKAVQDLERLVARAALGTAGPRDLVGLKQSLAVIPRVRARAGRAAGAARAVARRRARRPRRRPRRDRMRRSWTIRRRWRAKAASRATASTAELDELRTISRSGKQIIAEMEERERDADRHRVAEGPLQPRLRLLHRDLEVEPARGAVRLPPQADDRRRRALHHAGAQGVRREGARRRRADPRARAGDLRGAARGGRGRGAAHPGDGARARRRSTSWRRSRTRPPSTTTSSRTSTTATR